MNKKLEELDHTLGVIFLLPFMILLLPFIIIYALFQVFVVEEKTDPYSQTNLKKKGYSELLDVNIEKNGNKILYTVKKHIKRELTLKQYVKFYVADEKGYIDITRYVNSYMRGVDTDTRGKLIPHKGTGKQDCTYELIDLQILQLQNEISKKHGRRVELVRVDEDVVDNVYFVC